MVRRLGGASRKETVAVFALAGAVGGLVLALMLMGPPTGVQPTSACGPSTLVQDAGFDPWTGVPHGPVVQGRCMDHEYIGEGPVPPEIVGRWALPWASLLTIASALVGASVGLAFHLFRPRLGRFGNEPPSPAP